MYKLSPKAQQSLNVQAEKEPQNLRIVNSYHSQGIVDLDNIKKKKSKFRKCCLFPDNNDNVNNIRNIVYCTSQTLF